MASLAGAAKLDAAADTASFAHVTNTESRSKTATIEAVAFLLKPRVRVACPLYSIPHVSYPAKLAAYLPEALRWKGSDPTVSRAAI